MDGLKEKPQETGVCTDCSGAGWIVEDREGVEIATPCPRCSRENRRRRLLEYAEIPSRYQKSGFEEYKPGTPLQEQALTAAKRFVEEFPFVKRGLLLAGPCGVGKTHLSVAVLQALIDEKLTPGIFVDEAELLRRLQYSYGPEAPETEREVLIPLMEIDLLIWDDLGTGRPTEWVAETIRTILNHRYTHNKPTILSTNWKLSGGEKSGGPHEKTLEERIGARLYSRIMEMCQVIPIDGIDFRTEISKAGHDTLDRQRSVRPTRYDERVSGFDVSARLGCQSCGYKKIEVLDQRESGRGAGRYIDLQCRCSNCGEHFGAKYTIRTNRMEYFD